MRQYIETTNHTIVASHPVHGAFDYETGENVIYVEEFKDVELPGGYPLKLAYRAISPGVDAGPWMPTMLQAILVCLWQYGWTVRAVDDTEVELIWSDAPRK